jgi:Phage integrase family
LLNAFQQSDRDAVYGLASSRCLSRLMFSGFSRRLGDGRRRFAPPQLRYGHAVEMAREGVPLNVIQRPLGHTDLGVTSTYLQGIDCAEIINTIHNRRPPDDAGHRRPQALSETRPEPAAVAARWPKQSRPGPRFG